MPRTEPPPPPANSNNCQTVPLPPPAKISWIHTWNLKIKKDFLIINC